MNSVQKALEKLREFELFSKDNGKRTGLIKIEDAETILEELEIDLLQELQSENVY